MNIKKYVIANWKMNKTNSETVNFMEKFSKRIEDLKSTEVVICPSFLAIPLMNEFCKDKKIKIGAQNCYFLDSGAFTGEISAKMLKDSGAEYVILGHSERREYFEETGNIINKKIKSVLNNNLKVILCVGETQIQRENKQEYSVVKNQLKDALSGIKPEDFENILIAYEPIWAIGTGKVVTQFDAREMAVQIKEFISLELKLSKNCIVLYGGSVNASNAKEFFGVKEIDGGLIGGAALKEEEFMKIIQIAENS